MANRVSAQDVNEDMAAACKFGAFHWDMLCNPVSEVMNPTTPAMRVKIMKKPVVMLPIGKYIGNMRAGMDKTDAASQVINKLNHIMFKVETSNQIFFFS